MCKTLYHNNWLQYPGSPILPSKSCFVEAVQPLWWRLLSDAHNCWIQYDPLATFAWLIVTLLMMEGRERERMRSRLDVANLQYQCWPQLTVQCFRKELVDFRCWFANSCAGRSRMFSCKCSSQLWWCCWSQRSHKLAGKGQDWGEADEGLFNLFGCPGSILHHAVNGSKHMCIVCICYIFTWYN